MVRVTISKRKIKRSKTKGKFKKKSKKVDKKIWLEMMIVITILVIVTIAYLMWTATEVKYHFQENCEVVQVPYIEKTCDSTGCSNHTVDVEEVVCQRSVGNQTLYRYR